MPNAELRIDIDKVTPQGNVMQVMLYLGASCLKASAPRTYSLEYFVPKKSLDNLPNDTADKLSDILNRYPVLEQVNLEASCLSHQSANIILKALNQKGIVTLNLAVNNLLVNKICLEALGECIESNRGLHTLILDDNFSSDTFKELIGVLSSHPTLKTLSLQSLVIKEDIIPFAQALYSNKALKKLDLSGNEIDREGIEALIALLSHNNALERINLRGNKIDNHTAIKFAQAFASSSLKALEIDFYDCSFETLTQIADMIQQVNRPLDMYPIAREILRLPFASRNVLIDAITYQAVKYPPKALIFSAPTKTLPPTSQNALFKMCVML